MKAKKIHSGWLGALALMLTICFTVSFSWGVASALDYHNGYDCDDCHDMHGGSSNLCMIVQVDPPTSSNPVAFLNNEDPWDYADGDTTYDGICEVCHTSPDVKYYTNNGSGDPHPEYTLNEYTGGGPGTG